MANRMSICQLSSQCQFPRQKTVWMMRFACNRKLHVEIMNRYIVANMGSEHNFLIWTYGLRNIMIKKLRERRRGKHSISKNAEIKLWPQAVNRNPATISYRLKVCLLKSIGRRYVVVTLASRSLISP